MNIDEKIKTILDEHATYEYFSGDPKRGGISEEEALLQLKSLFRDYIKQGEIDNPKEIMDGAHINYVFWFDKGKKDQIEALLKGLE